MADGVVLVLVGHCGPDVWMLRGAISAMVPGADVRVVNSDEDLRAELGEASGLLVNRVLDGSFGTESGVELIRVLSAGERSPRMALVSNFAEAQEEAESAGAIAGFGKSDLHSDAMRATLEALVSGG